MEQMEKNLLKTVADISGFMPGSAFSLRKNGAGVERHSTEHVKILAKTDKPGIDIIVDANTVGESSTYSGYSDRQRHSGYGI